MRTSLAPWLIIVGQRPVSLARNAIDPFISMRQTGSPENRDYLEELRGSNSFVKVAAPQGLVEAAKR